MPTPESALFLAKKPTVPPTFNGVDYDDQTRLKQAQDAIIREQWVRSMMARLVREELGKCYYREGVNHLEKCGGLRGMFPLVFFERGGGIGGGGFEEMGGRGEGSLGKICAGGFNGLNWTGLGLISGWVVVQSGILSC